MGDVISMESDFWHSDVELPHGVTDVWALDIETRGHRAHFWRRERHGYRRLCDGYDEPAFRYNGRSPLYGAGSYPKCKHCMNRLRPTLADTDQHDG